MQTPFSLDSRLALCAEFVREGTKLADIGTDHAYLPVHLALAGRITSAVAADINPDPLARGRMTIEKYNVSHLVSTRLCPGLEDISADEADDIVIAGMGADTIIGIIDSALWLKDENKRLILQPMTKGERLVKYLYENGFEIISQRGCIADGKPYSVMHVRYTGQTTGCDELFTYVGKLCPENFPDDREYLLLQAKILSRRAAADIRNAELSQQITERIAQYDNNQ